MVPSLSPSELSSGSLSSWDYRSEADVVPLPPPLPPIAEEDPLLWEAGLPVARYTMTGELSVYLILYLTLFSFLKFFTFLTNPHAEALH